MRHVVLSTQQKRPCSSSMKGYLAQVLRKSWTVVLSLVKME